MTTPPTREAFAPLLFLIGVIMFALGGIVTYRSDLIRDRPHIAFVVLVCYGCAVLGLIAMIGYYL